MSDAAAGREEEQEEEAQREDAEEGEGIGGGRKRRRVTRSFDVLDGEGFALVAGGGGGGSSSSFSSSSPMTLDAFSLRLTQVETFITLGFRVPQQVFEWILNRILEPPQVIDYDTSQSAFGCECKQRHKQNNAKEAALLFA